MRKDYLSFVRVVIAWLEPFVTDAKDHVVPHPRRQPIVILDPFDFREEQFVHLLVADVAVVVLDGLQLLVREADVKILRLSKPRLVWDGFNGWALLPGLLIEV